MVIKRLTNHLTDCASGGVAGGRNDCFSFLSSAQKQNTQAGGRGVLVVENSTKHGENTLMILSSYGTNPYPKRCQDFEGKTILRG